MLIYKIHVVRHAVVHYFLVRKLLRPVMLIQNAKLYHAIITININQGKLKARHVQTNRNNL